MKIQNLRGTKDIFGEDALLWESVEETARSVFRKYGYTPLRTPIIEDKALFSRSVGEATDIVQKEMYQIQSRGDSEVEIVLRPEGTASVVRAVIQNNLLKESPTAKLYYHGPMFRAERPQAGRYRQFSQIGVEFFGGASSYADAEVIEVLVRFYEAVGIRDFVLQINNLGDAEERNKYSVILRDYLTQHISELCSDCRSRVQKNILRVLDCKTPPCQPALNAAPKIADVVSAESRKRFEDVKKLLTALGIAFTENFRIVRGLDYYTHTVFELIHGGLGAQNALAAGGRYDMLAKNLGEGEIPAVGFALGLDRLIDLLKKKEDRTLVGAQEPRVAVVAMDDTAKEAAFMCASRIRQSGFDVIADVSRSSKSQLRQANKDGARWAVLLGQNEVTKNVVRIKDMTGVAPEVDIPQNEFVANTKKFFTTSGQ